MVSLSADGGKRSGVVDKSIEDVRQYWFVISELTGREIKRKYARSYLGVIWSVLNPLLYMLVMTLVFSTMFKRNIDNYPLYFVTGHILWSVFSSITGSVMTVLQDNRGLLMKAKLPKRVFILSRCYTALVNLLYSLIAYMPIVFITGVKPSPVMLLLIPDIICITVFSLGIGYILSILYVFFADIKYLWSVVMTLWMYLSALFYPVDRLNPVMQDFVYNNPVYDFILFARECMVYGRVPDARLFARIVIFAVGSYLLGYLIFKKYENEVMKKL